MAVILESNSTQLPIRVVARSKASSLARKLGSSVRIPLKAWRCVCVYVRVYSEFVLSRVKVAALRRTDLPSKESYSLCKKDYEPEMK
jgi:hypothetical protein